MTKRTETSQERLNRLMTEAQNRTPRGATIHRNGRVGTWNGSAWVFGGFVQSKDVRKW